MSGGGRGGPFMAALRRAWPVLVAYGVFSVWGVGCLVMSLALTTGGFGLAPGDFGVVAGLVLATALGQVAGNLLGLARLRLAVVVIAFMGGMITASVSGLVLGGLAVFALVFVIAALGGYLGVASRLDVVASWFPLSFAVGGAIIWMNHHGAVATFNGGAKHALWDPFTIICLAGAVFLNLVFLATRQSLGLAVWQEVGRPASAVRSEGAGAARPGRGSLLVLLVFSIAVLGVTAMISPYLFRTVEHDGDTPSKGNGSDQQTPTRSRDRGSKPSDRGDGEPTRGEPLGAPDGKAASAASSAALEMGMRLMGWLIAMALILFAIGVLVFAPLRRAFLLRHLERPIWPVSPTTRVINLWRRAVAALAVVGLTPAAGEAPRAFARRASGELARVLGSDGSPLEVAADVVERVDYEGRGLGWDDERVMREAVGAIVASVRGSAGVKRRLAAAWGPAPEIER